MLTFEEIRVLGVLIEKSKTTPDYYPMTLNGITTACNQKSSRKPITDFSESEVSGALLQLKQKGLIATEIGGGSRTVKYRHCFRAVHPVTEGELTALCLLFLRGALTPGEINSNSGRIYEYEGLQEVLTVLHNLQDRELPFVKELARQSGQKENRWIQLLGVVAEEESQNLDVQVLETNNSNSLDVRVSNLEEEVIRLNKIVLDLVKELKG